MKTTIPQLSLKREKTDFIKTKITSSKCAADYIRQFYGDDLTIYESFFLLLLNNANNTIGYVKISQGGCTGTVVDVKIVAKYVIESLAQSVILCHNHPSGMLKPSQSDIDLTKKVSNALAFVDSRVMEHIILTEDSYFSFADEGMI